MTYRPPRRVVRLRSTKLLENRLKRLNLSAAELCRLTGISRQSIGRLRMEHATGMRVEHAEAIERALSVKHGYLFDFAEYDRGGGVVSRWSGAPGEWNRPQSQVAALERWAFVPDPAEATSAGRAAFLASFEDKVDPDQLLPEPERRVRAERALRAHMIRLANASAEKRRRK